MLSVLQQKNKNLRFVLGHVLNDDQSEKLNYGKKQNIIKNNK